MKTSLEKISQVRYKINVETSAESLPQKINQKLIQIQKNSKMDGFRRGKVPLNLIKKNYESIVNSECIEDLINDSYREALKKENLIPVSSPKLEVLSKLPLEKTLEYTAEFDVFPTVKLQDLSQLKLETISYQSNESDVLTQLEQIKKRNPSYKETNEKAKEGDALDITYQLLIQDQPEFDKPNELRVVIGSKSMIPGFEEKMIGLKKGDQTEFELTFPKDYPHNLLKGENVKFKIEVIKVENPIEVELNDEFAKKMGAKDLADLKANLAKNIETQAKSVVDNHNRQKIVEALLKANEFEIPESMVHQEQHHLFDQQKSQMEKQKQNTSDLKMSEFKDAAHKRVKTSLIFNQIAEDFEIKDDPKRFDAKLEEISKQYGEQMKIDVIKKFYNENQDQKKSLQQVCLEEAILDLINSKANTTNKEMNFEQLIEITQKSS